jgi:hypothetical protein
MLSSKLVRHAPAPLLAAVLTACAPAAVKDIAANKTAYLAENFSPQQLPPDVSKQLAAAGPVTLGFQSMTIKISAVFEDNSKKETPTLLATLKNVGNGVVQEMLEYSNNDIPYGIEYSLSYMALLPLKSQRVFYNRQTANFAIEAKHLNEVPKDAVKLREETDYVFDWASGTSPQLMNFSNIRLVCRSGKFYSAATLHAKLAGNAIDFNCTRHVNGVVRARQKFAVLERYGLALKLEFKSSTITETYRIGDVEIL